MDQAQKVRVWKTYSSFAEKFDLSSRSTHDDRHSLPITKTHKEATLWKHQEENFTLTYSQTPLTNFNVHVHPHTHTHKHATYTFIHMFVLAFHSSNAHTTNPPTHLINHSTCMYLLNSSKCNISYVLSSPLWMEK